jgi:hypothetical protein
MAYLGNSPFVSGNFSSTTHSGTGSSLGPFAIGQSPGTKNAVLVFIDGVRQVPTIYGVSGSDVTFTAGNAPPLGTDNVQILVSGEELGVNVPADDSIAVAALDTTSAGTTGQFLKKSSATDIDWATVDALPSQTSQSGKFLTTDGSAASWGNEIPTQTGHSGKYLTTDGSATSWAEVASGTSWQSVQTTDFTAVAGKGYPVNTTAGAIDITLPVSASVGDTIEFVDYAGTFQTNEALVKPNGLKLKGGTGDLKFNKERLAAKLVYVDATQGWVANSANRVNTLSALYAATGGTITYSGAYTIHTFLAGGNFIVTTGSGNVEVLLVGGAGGGASQHSGGGGAGGYRTFTGLATTVQTYAVVVGGGGNGGAATASSSGSDGTASTAFGYSSAGGGGGGSYPGTAGRAGGSGGGGGTDNAAGGSGNSPSTTPSQGTGGGTATSHSANGGGGGGGGSATGGSASNAGTHANAGGPGGAGTLNNIDGNGYYWAAGGGGAGHVGGTTAGAGGQGGGGGGGNQAGSANSGGAGGINPGGAGSTSNPSGGNGGANTGSGGGGSGSNTTAAGNGGSGIVIVKYLT